MPVCAGLTLKHDTPLHFATPSCLELRWGLSQGSFMQSTAWLRYLCAFTLKYLWWKLSRRRSRRHQQTESRGNSLCEVKWLHSTMKLHQIATSPFCWRQHKKPTTTEVIALRGTEIKADPASLEQKWVFRHLHTAELTRLGSCYARAFFWWWLTEGSRAPRRTKALKHAQDTLSY